MRSTKPEEYSESFGMRILTTPTGTTGDGREKRGGSGRSRGQSAGQDFANLCVPFLGIV